MKATDKQKNIDLEDAPTISLLEELKRRFRLINEPERRLLLIGPPGCGKGTQSQSLKTSFGICHIAAGDLLREAAAADPELKQQIQIGELVKDELILNLVENKINEKQCKKGFILDGFPRNLQQAEKFDSLLNRMKKSLDAVLYLEVPDEELSKRITGRRIHEGSGRLYNVFYKPPKEEGKDDITGDFLVRRNDDNEETLKKRLDVFKKDTLPIIKFYSDSKLLSKIDGSMSTEDVNKKIKAIIKSLNGKSKTVDH